MGVVCSLLFGSPWVRDAQMKNGVFLGGRKCWRETMLQLGVCCLCIQGQHPRVSFTFGFYVSRRCRVVVRIFKVPSPHHGAIYPLSVPPSFVGPSEQPQPRLEGFRVKALVSSPSLSLRVLFVLCCLRLVVCFLGTLRLLVAFSLHGTVCMHDPLHVILL